MRFDKSFVKHWSELYVTKMGDTELWLFKTVGPSVKKRGYLTQDDLIEIGRWKSARSTGFLNRNSAGDVKEVTRLALRTETPDRFRHQILTMLEGVGHPVASAILTVWNPEKNTVLDFRAVGALKKLSTLRILGSPGPGGRFPDYWTYLGIFGPVAKRLGVSHRDLDRALWKWHKEGMPTR